MAPKKIKLVSAFSKFAVLMISSVVYAGPTVSGNVISWTEPGWHQVQLQRNYESVCNGGRQCIVPAGVYTVINHGTGERFPYIVVPDNATNNDNSAPAPVALSGQVISYAFGDDGDFQTGMAVPGVRFHDNDDGTFIDTLTGITWLGIRDCIVKRSWAVAIEYANNLSTDSDICPALNDDSGAGDWRLPNIKELYSLVDVSDNSPVWAQGIPFSGSWSDFPWDLYWSSTSFQPIPNDNAFVMDASFGLISSLTKSSVYYVWPIRVEK